jgi:hypothetical protein
MSTHKRLYVIGVLSNPVRYEARWRLYRQFQKHMADSGVTLITVEQAFGERPFMVTEAGNPQHVQVRAGDESELWVKESLINIGLRHLTERFPRWQYMAWIDGDVQFVNPGWADETIAGLEHYRIVQPWSHCIDLGPKHEHVGHATSLAYCFNHQPFDHGPRGKYGTPFWHPGYAWAMRRSTLEALGGKLMDWCILGAGDNHMAWGFLGDIKRAIAGAVTNENYLAEAAKFQLLCDTFVQQDVGYVPGTIMHYWHGKKRNRFYVERWKLLTDNNYDPHVDIRTNDDGLVVWTDTNIPLQHAVRRYLRSRAEDSTDLE